MSPSSANVAAARKTRRPDADTAPLQTVAQDTADRGVRPSEMPADGGFREETGMSVRGVISQKAVSGPPAAQVRDAAR